MADESEVERLIAQVLDAGTVPVSGSDTDVKWTYFTGLAEQQAEIARYRSFLEAANAGLNGLDAEQREHTRDYLSEMKAVVDGIDPLATPDLILPVITEPGEEQLKKYMA